MASDVTFTFMEKARICATCATKGLARKRVKSAANWRATFTEGIMYPKRKSKDLCLHHAAMFAIKHGGGKIDLGMFQKKAAAA